MKEGNTGNLEKITPIERFEDLRMKDLSNRDLKNIPIDTLMTTIFDSQTKWPKEENLPKGFNSEIVLENGKNPGLGLRELHNQGITGKGINVAIIDQKLDTNHREYASNIASYEEFGKSTKEGISMHGPAVSSLLVGKNCGVAPEAKLHYYANPSANNSSWDCASESLNKIINFNNTAEEKDKIKIVSYSNGHPNPVFKGDLENWKKTIKKAKDSGIIFTDANTFFDLNFTGGGSTNKEDIDQYYLWLAIDNKLAFYAKMNSSWNKKDNIIIPSDYRTFASSWKKDTSNDTDKYMFNGKGGISWSIPYLSGIFALMLQVNKNLKMDEMVKIIKDTVSINKNGLKIINPTATMEVAKNLNEK